MCKHWSSQFPTVIGLDIFVFVQSEFHSSADSSMSKSLVDLCMFCIANNLENINRVGTFLSKNDNELVLELLCDHDMFTASRMPYITYQLLTSRLKNIAFGYSSQVDDTLLQNVALSGCKLKSFILKNCPQVSGERVNN